MRVDFYQLSRDSVEAALPLIARASLGAGERLLVVSADDGQRGRISEALWTRLPESFLAHGQAGGAHDARQPILIAGPSLMADGLPPANGARFLVLADGIWREAEGFARVFLMFDDVTLAGARACWRLLGERESVERRFWKQQGGKWVEGP
jgi:DNA polymerase-3 subunit chi